LLATSQGARLHYEVAGEGDAVLLIMGLGMASTGWWRTVPVLAERFRVITFDNRGAGRSDSPRGPYTLAQLAADAVAILDAAEEERAHVYGLSLGGMIAQELALRHPARVHKLVLGATTPGGRRHELPDEAALGFFERRGRMPAEEGVWASVPYNYGYATRVQHADRIGQDAVQRLRFPVSPEGYKAQLAAAWRFDAVDRLAQLTTPALVLHGSEDRMIPVSNGRRLAEAIPDARLQILEGAGHLYMTDAPEADRDVLHFLAG
jgi:3-oxoadipate enol-lactonase